MTIDGFSLTGDPLRGFPRVQADFSVTTYLVPPEQGISAGATPGGPGAGRRPRLAVPVAAEHLGTAPAAAAP